MKKKIDFMLGMLFSVATIVFIVLFLTNETFFNCAYTGTSGRRFRKHPDTKPEVSGHFAG